MKYLSFSLWGEKPIYNIGIIRNAELWKTIYPEWKMVVFYDSSVPIETINRLKELDVMLEDMTSKNIYGMFWRFFAVNLPDSEYAIFRDGDSRISLREKLAVDEWIQNDTALHVMRDHPYHQIPCGNNQIGILGGMWGIKSKTISLVDMIESYQFKSTNIYGQDQAFLKFVYFLLKDNMTVHDEFFSNKPFPIRRENQRFIGERIDEYDIPLTDDYKLV